MAQGALAKPLCMHNGGALRLPHGRLRQLGGSCAGLLQGGCSRGHSGQYGVLCMKAHTRGGQQAGRKA